MGFLSVLSFAHHLISERIQPGDHAVDATAGTGIDTLFLAKQVGRKGHVYAFDVQEEALKLTKARLAREQDVPLASLSLLHHSHDQMQAYLPAAIYGRLAAVMFNLGYLPTEGSDRSTITESSSTLAALEVALSLLKPRGIITAVLYPGHAGGDLEATAVTEWATSLPQVQAQSIVYRQLQRMDAPYVIAIEKR
ncbi:tRNA 5-(aminomethyl)-2-thiouridylate-methyltransferase MnmM [Paenibacillus pini]|uniref:SAM-dependent methyltransferase n=1 Tax=Paenibacillus pini JCM 16418 TaxID=1236976 RepID=W7Y5T8_9BACL|nr:class I SAM-dependent methyltransferase [Paenibacillus pini]GAF06140.1 SAM-dependent methyltransferase [Paenibacillus pini JCM 16418]